MGSLGCCVRVGEIGWVGLRDALFSGVILLGISLQAGRRLRCTVRDAAADDHDFLLRDKTAAEKRARDGPNSEPWAAKRSGLRIAA